MNAAELRILFVCVEFPYPANNGVRLRNSYLLRALVELGHYVTLLSFVQSSDGITIPADLASRVSVRNIVRTVSSLSTSNDYIRRLIGLLSSDPFSVARFRSEEMRQTIDEVLRTQQVDLVISDTDFTMANLTAITDVPLLQSHHNAEHVILSRYAEREHNPAKSTYASIEASKMKSWAKRIAPLAGSHIVCSDNDREEFAKLGIAPIYVVPNIFEASGAMDVSITAEPRTLIFQGGMDWLPNRDAVQFFASEILPIVLRSYPDVRLIVAGRFGPANFIEEMRKYPQLSFTGTVDDISRYIRGAEISIVPLRIGSGTRLKILEAASYGRPIVSTSVGAEGLRFVDGEEILIADNPTEFAEAVIRLLDEEPLRIAIGSSARARVQSDYSMKVFKQALRAAIDRCMQIQGAIESQPHRKASGITL
jgi:polysaccharide biosynthesis protein PslH